MTGAGSGIGRACALRCASEGANVLVADIDEQAACATAALIAKKTRGCSGKTAVLAVDISKSAEVEKMVRAAVEQFGGLDGAVNCAGIEGERAGIDKMSLENFDRVMGVNARGLFLCMRAEVRQMLKQIADGERERAEARGSNDDDDVASSQNSSSVCCGTFSQDAAIDQTPCSIVNISSTAGSHGMPEFAAYCASKHAVLGLTRAVAGEVASRGITVNAVLPSTTDTPMVRRFARQWPAWQAQQNASFAIGRVCRPEEIAAAVVFLLSGECRAIAGSTLVVDGASRL